MCRTKLAERKMPSYTRAEEICHMVTHIVGGGIGVLALVLCVVTAALHQNVWGVVTCAVYGGTLVTVYAVSSVYHGLLPSMGKRVMQVLDHCAIYGLIAGTYTPIVLVSLRPEYPVLAWGLLAAEWGLAALAITLTAIDLQAYSVFSMLCYVGMGWCIMAFPRAVTTVLGANGFALLLAGGIAYTVGAVLYGLGKKRRYVHALFHVFVDIGSLLHALCIWLYVA